MNLNIADRPLSLAGHLRNVANLIESHPSIYDWTISQRCNCGLIARAITGLNGDDLMRLYCDAHSEARVGGIWQDIGRALDAKCAFNPETKVPEVFRRLIDGGLQLSDFEHVENLSHPKLTPWHGMARCNQHRCVVKYFRKWAGKIEEYRAEHPEIQTPPTAAPTDQELEAIETRPLVAAQ